ncbi:hypothetical protein F7734_27100 [Scytonema sp. UIC 10036]|uniref:prenyltransferase/squalene oxidase repeat-containing protein n=1 Tax=Scytonema sp. UIC 10036 TaxID=2304196 RepID=UPI0012DAF087|nr:prenyltransferase/squalene oxidase repeat-containing protein [Scytonema sp. UIC 10036]MUG95827.1 hypothetical protein [Scytonema sp. UIC 10036]
MKTILDRWLLLEPDLAIAKGIHFLYENQLPDGEFRTYFAETPNMKSECRFDSSPFVTAAVLYSLGFADNSKVNTIIQRGIDFLIKERQEPGLWKYWTSKSTTLVHQNLIEPDLDDTSCVSYICQKYGYSNLVEHNLKLILKNRNDLGLFYTWIRNERAKNDIDSVVNANVLLYLGECEEIKNVCHYLNHLILEAQEKQSYWYYINDLSLYYALSRAYFNGVHSLQIAGDTIINRVVSTQKENGSWGDDLYTAYAICTLLNFGYGNKTVLSKAVHYLLRRQQDNGSWSRIAIWAGPEPPIPHSVWWGSQDLTTAVCVEALVRYL